MRSGAYRQLKRNLVLTAASLAIVAGVAPAMARGSGPQDAEPVSAGWADPNGIDDYAWIDRADTLSETLGDTPPDYSFAFEDEQPWAWVLDDGSLVIVEQRDDGPYSYYYDPGHDEPFLVRGPERSYAFMLGRPVVMYDPEGAVLRHAEGDAYLDEAMDSLERGRDLQHAWQQREEQPVEMSLWLEFSPIIESWSQEWDTGRRIHQGWRARHLMRDALEQRVRLERERRRREQVTQRFQQWRDRGWQGAAPGRWHRPPAGWTPRPGGWHRPGKGVPDRPQPGRPGGWHRPDGTRPGTGGPAQTPAPGRPGGWHRPDRTPPVTGGPAQAPRPGNPGTVPPPRPGGAVTPPHPNGQEEGGRPDRPRPWNSPRTPRTGTPAPQPEQPRGETSAPVRQAEPHIFNSGAARPAVRPAPAAVPVPRTNVSPPPRPSYTPAAPRSSTRSRGEGSSRGDGWKPGPRTKSKDD